MPKKQKLSITAHAATATASKQVLGKKATCCIVCINPCRAGRAGTYLWPTDWLPDVGAGAGLKRDVVAWSWSGILWCGWV